MTRQLILLELRFAKVHGLEVSLHWRADERTRLLPVVILASSIKEVNLFNGYRLGANSCAGKSVDSAEFTEVIAHWDHTGSSWMRPR